MQAAETSRTQVADITRQLYDRRQFAYICVDRLWCVQQVSENLRDFGFAWVEKGSDVTDAIDFLVGADIDVGLDFPLMTSPNGIPVRVILMPTDSTMTVVIMDAYEEFHQQYQLQQKANENQLLLDNQKKLMAELEQARQQLQIKNTQLEEAGRLQTSFLSGVSHEFRSPLTSIMGYTNLLLTGVDEIDEASAADYLLAVQRSSKHLLSLIENLLDHGKVDSGEIVINPKATDLAQVFDDVERLVKPLATTKNIEFVLKTDFSGNESALIDDSRLRQCLINLIGNAIKFTDVGGVSVAVSWVADRLEIVVEDTGIGISTENLAKIRQPFWQAPDTGKAGTGLGLTITDRITAMMGGTLSIDSQQHKGTIVRFAVRAPRVLSSPQQQIETSPCFPEGLKVLLAEDDEDISNLVLLLLQQQGVQVTHVENGALAIEALKHDRSFDLVLMDIHMPILDGFAAVQSIRETGNQIPIVMMTASATDVDRNRAKELGTDGYLVKPVEMLDLILMTNQLLGQN